MAMLFRRRFLALITSVGLLAFIAGVAVSLNVRADIGGQTLPPPSWGFNDDVEYFVPGHKFTLQNEAEARALYRENQRQLRLARP